MSRECPVPLLAAWLVATLLVPSLRAQTDTPKERERTAQEGGAEPIGKAAPNAAAVEADRLADQLKKHPPKLSIVEDPLRLFMLDRQDGSVTLVADEPDPDSNHVGSPRWSHDGKRILFDAMRGEEYLNLRLKAIECGKEAPTLTDLGLGACPAWSPDCKRIAFLWNSQDPAVHGIWVMEADGSQRRRAGEYGIPLWSPDGRSFLIVSFGEPRSWKRIDIETGEMKSVEVPNGKFRSWPTWADADSIVTVIGTDQTSNAIVLVKVAAREEPTVTATLWQRSPERDFNPAWPVYSAATRRCIFVDQDPMGMALYEAEHGKLRQIKRLEQGGLDTRIAGLSLSPGGRYLLFCSTRPVAAAR